MKKYSLLLLSFFLIQCSSGKMSELYQVYNSKDFLYWSENKKLTWDDFQGEPLDSSGLAGEIQIYNPSTIEKASLFSSAKLTSICVFDKKHSWINKKFASGDILLYNQTIFDIYEVYTRILRRTFDSTVFSLTDYTQKFHQMTEKNNSELKDRIEKFRKESNLGQNRKALITWSFQIKKELDSLKEYKFDSPGDNKR